MIAFSVYREILLNYSLLIVLLVLLLLVLLLVRYKQGGAAKKTARPADMPASERRAAEGKTADDGDDWIAHINQSVAKKKKHAYR